MKKLISAVLSLSLVFASSTFVFANEVVATTSAIAVTEAPYDYDFVSISTSGKGEVSVAPDVAYVTLVLNTTGADTKSASSANAKEVDNILSALNNAGIKSDDIVTSYYYIYPEYDYNYETYEERIKGYTVNHELNVTIRDLSKVNEYIDLAIDNGVDTTYGVSYGIEDDSAYYNEALKLAYKNAMNKGQVLANLAGKSNLTVDYMYEDYGYGYGYYDSAYSRGYSTDIQQPSEIKVQASISVSFQAR